MKKMLIANRQEAAPLCVESEAFEGVKRIAGKVALDVEKVCGTKQEVMEVDASWAEAGGSKRMVLVATLGHSPLVTILQAKGLLKEHITSGLEGKREVYALCLIANPFPEVEELLLILGSDKRGTIYGLFQLSEYMGVSPLCYWGDVEPQPQEEFYFTESLEMISKEPSVRYRGFFINDEWPCFGNWTFSHFGGFTAEMYDHVFELLLRMKGNYLWPAMWTSSFPLDGPGCLNEELADIYGVVIGFSHHEPCLRASEEWDQVRGVDSPYGNEWNYYTNAEGLSRYWADGLARSGKYEHLVTIGMRGERDSSMLGEDATLQENIDLLKDIITKQRQLIGEHVNKEVDQVPQLLALYKEVENYFYGDETAEGLQQWDELENVIFMLCEDNFGHMRTLPTEEMRKHKGGYGMYYHLDYHGSPISYEWMPSTPFSLIWEQMTEAYDYGIRDVWIVNVGDLKGNEIALQYFLSLAYDFEKWGSSRPGSYREYLSQWTADTFPAVAAEVREQMAAVYDSYVALNAKRRPEALHAGIYHPCHYRESERMLEEASCIEQRNEAVYQVLQGTEKDAYFSLIYYAAKTSINLLRMHLYAGINAHYAMQGRKVANEYGEQMKACITEDKRLSAEFGAFRDGKWKGMELEQHIGFTKWNDDGWRYPVRMEIEPVTAPRMSVSRADEEFLAVKNYGTPMRILVDDFCWEGCDEAAIEISNDGVGILEYEIQPLNGQTSSWLSWSESKGTVENLSRVLLHCDRENMPETSWNVDFALTDGDTTVTVAVKGCGRKQWSKQGLGLSQEIPNLFLPGRDGLVMEAEHIHSAKDVKGAGYRLLADYGRSDNGRKVLPSTAVFEATEEKPTVTYAFYMEAAGDYQVELWTAPSNSLRAHASVNMTVERPVQQTITLLPEDYRGGDWTDERWCRGVLDQVHKHSFAVSLAEGVNYLELGAMDAGVVLERILIYPVGKPPKESYLGPQESVRLFQS